MWVMWLPFPHGSIPRHYDNVTLWCKLDRTFDVSRVEGSTWCSQYMCSPIMGQTTPPPPWLRKTAQERRLKSLLPLCHAPEPNQALEHWRMFVPWLFIYDYQSGWGTPNPDCVQHIIWFGPERNNLTGLNPHPALKFAGLPWANFSPSA